MPYLWAEAQSASETLFELTRGEQATVNLVYLVASILFIVGLKGLAHPRTAVRGNLLGSIGMLAAIVVTLLVYKVVGIGVILAGIVVGSVLGAILAIKVPMTGMPQMVGLLNGFGGGASVLVAAAALLNEPLSSQTPAFLIATTVSGLIGAVTFWGSLVACAKLQEIKAFAKPFSFPNQQLINGGLFVLCLLIGVWLTAGDLSSEGQAWVYALLAVAASALGVLVVLPIGGADMPVVVALLNSYSGLAATATGFVLENEVLIVSGSLVGASGIILSQIMCRAMNRSLTNVLFGGMGSTASTGADADEVYAGKVKSTTPDEVAMILDGARRVVFVPGYGLAVSQAQHAVRDLYRALEARGAEVEFAIHPVAGRMPGHMNVLLAEADIPYDRLKEMDEVNPTFDQVDVAIVLGANDVVNPLARTDPTSAIAGMPILDVDKAQTVIVIKRSLSPGFAGIPNPLFALPNTLMLFADGKAAVHQIVNAMKEM